MSLSSQKKENYESKIEDKTNSDPANSNKNSY